MYVLKVLHCHNFNWDITAILAEAKYVWIHFHCAVHEFNKTASLRAGVDKKVGSAGEIPPQKEGIRDVRTSADALQICNAE